MNLQKKKLVCGAGGFIGAHLVTSLKKQGHYVIGVDLKHPEYSKTDADEFHISDLRNQSTVEKIISSDLDEIYQLAADMGGAGYIFNGKNDADIMCNNAIINLNVLREMSKKAVKRIFYSSSACIYPAHNQKDSNNVFLAEDSAYPAAPDSEYGWEKLFSERLYLSFAKNFNMHVRIARFHNIFGPLGSWNNGKEKAPAALCRKIVLCNEGDQIEVWGPGNQTRSFLYIDECIEGIHKIMKSKCEFPLNLGSEKMININDLVYLISKIIGKTVHVKNVFGPIGVMARTSNNKLIEQYTGWKPNEDLTNGLLHTYQWIQQQITNNIKT